MNPSVAVSIVIPCLNESETIATCVRSARNALDDANLTGEIIVADNGSTDGSAAIAEAAGARVIHAALRGYGSALMTGIDAASGSFIVMADGDASYDFGETPKFIAQLRAGFDLVQGCRLPGGGGQIVSGAMPVSHRWIGNPMFSLLVRWWFGANIHDVLCGFRAFTKDAYNRLQLQCTGMEFAAEMIIKASIANLRVGEVPITLHKDGRTNHPPHVRTYRDGWRTLRFYLLFSPRWLFLLPGIALACVGATAAVAGFAGVHVGGARLDVHTLLFGALMIIAGYQAIIFAILSKQFAVNANLLPPDHRLRRFAQMFTLERGLSAGGVLITLGCVLLVRTVLLWSQHGFGELSCSHTMRLAIPGVLATVTGMQTVLFVFFASVLQLNRRVVQQ